jgi:hypothetical protein
VNDKDVDARHKAGHDEREPVIDMASRVGTAQMRLSPPHDCVSGNLRQFKAELFEGIWIVHAPRGIQDFNVNDTAFVVVVDHDAISDFCAVFDGPIRQIEVNSVGGVIDSYTHGFVLSN